MTDNKVLKRQLKKLKITDFESLDEVKLQKLLDVVTSTYESMDDNVYRLERALDISTAELRDFSDNLEIKIQEELAKNREKDKKLLAQSRFASMGEMIGNIAHQWRQPLSAISSTASSMQLQRELGILQDEDIDKSYENILKYSDFLSQTIEDFRSFLKEDSDRKEFNVIDVVSKTLFIVSSAYTNNRIDINSVNLSNQEKLTASGFPSKLTQVFLNLFNNAKDALIANIEESERRICITYDSNPNYHIVCVQDNAGGVPENIIEKVFDPYFTTKHQAQGTGIGLYMSRNIVEDIGGEIKVENKQTTIDKITYNGACFTITLPRV